MIEKIHDLKLKLDLLISKNNRIENYFNNKKLNIPF